jgi:hypothetical protein
MMVCIAQATAKQLSLYVPLPPTAAISTYTCRVDNPDLMCGQRSRDRFRVILLGIVSIIGNSASATATNDGFRGIADGDADTGTGSDNSAILDGH